MKPIQLPDKLLLKNVRLVDAEQNIDQPGSLLIESGVITALNTDADDATVWDLDGAVVCPGFVDMHVHLREPGFEDAETIKSGQKAAAAGGFTAVACMPNTNPALDHAGIVRWIIEEAESFPITVYPIAAITKNRAGLELTEMVELHRAGALAFSDDGGCVENTELMRRALEYSKLTGAPIIDHAEDFKLTGAGSMHESAVSTRLGLPGIPRLSEDIMTVRDVMLAEYTGGKLHLAHVSTKGALEALEDALKRGLPVTGEVSPHHLLLTDKAVESFDTSTKMKPPLREEEDRLALIEGMKRGAFAAIATDHAPHPYETKEVPFDEAAFGIIGLETALGLIWDRFVRTKVISAADMVRLFSNGPRQVLGLPEVSLTAGTPVELTVFHPDEKWVVNAKEFYTKSRNTPFNGWELIGRPWGILKGSMWAGRVTPSFK
ncbi:dihydroorotase [bacterium]|nr:dihydroorotase [bacterium]MBU1652498.1 dihydroorotase [bacterium]MBU1881658.1 dihydroorotase [bacterium]